MALEPSESITDHVGIWGGDGLPRDISCFRLMLPKGTLFSEEGPVIRSVVMAEVRRIEAGCRTTSSWPTTCSTHQPTPSSRSTATSAPRSGTGMPMASRAQRGDWSISASMPCWCSQAERYPSRRGETPGVAGQGLPAAMPAGWNRRQHQRQLATRPLTRPLIAGVRLELSMV